MSRKEVESESVSLIKWFSELSNKSIDVAGGKGASLAEMYNNKFPVPPGFIVSAQAYKYFIEKSGLAERIKFMLSDLDVNDTEKLNKVSGEIRGLIEKAHMPAELESEILEAYEILDVSKQHIENAKGTALGILKRGHEPPFVAVRSSATAEDLADASFAGQQDSFLNVKGKSDLIENIKKCFSSLFTARAIYYRTQKKFEHDKVYLAVVVQRMIDSEKSGVMFSRNPIKNDGSILIEAVFGLGEGIVSGKIKPDSYTVDKGLDNFKVINIEINEKRLAIVRNSSGKNEIVKLTSERGNQQVLTSYEIKRLAQYARHLEEHYGKPQDIEFAIESNEIFIVQSRPITTKFEDHEQKELTGEVLLNGLGASPGIGSGKVKIIHDLNELDKVKPGDILVTEMTNPDMVVAMQRAAGIITDEGGITSHASIISREMGIPAVVGTGNATKKLKEGQIVTVDGFTGRILEGRSEIREAEIKPILKTKTKIKVIVDLPDFAERAAKSGSKAVGLVRLEGIIASSGKHPVKFVKENKIENYVEILVKGLRKIAEPFEEIWIRSSDIRSDEFRNLEGAPKNVEGNPMLGDHGVRFSLRHPQIIEAEFKAVKEIADEFPSKKIGLMMPQIISVSELAESKRIAKEVVGIPNNVQIGIMVETPAAVQIINQLCEEGIDFISFGTNDLTQFTLAIDRNNGDVQYLYDEMHPAVLNSLRYVIKRCKHYGVETSLCGQAGSREDMAKFLVEQGIDSVSVNADAAYKVSEVIAQAEKEFTNRNFESEQDEKGISSREKEKEKDIISVERTIEVEIPSAKINVSAVETEDIEDLVLKELEGDDYSPGNKEDKNEKDIPSLNDAIPVESIDLMDNAKESEIDLNSLILVNANVEEGKESKESSEVETKKIDDNADDEETEGKDEEEEVLGGAIADELLNDNEELEDFDKNKEWAPASKNNNEDEVLDIF